MAEIELGAPTGAVSQINDALNDANIHTVRLGPYRYEIEASVIIPSGKTLLGSGRSRSTIAPLDPFDRTIPALVATLPNTTNVRLADFAIDVEKMNNGQGPTLRTHALRLRQTSDFVVERVDVMNATGYGHYHEAEAGFGGRNGVWRDCRASNCNVCFEQMAMDGCVIDNCEADNGDGDIACEAMFHCLNGSRNITYSKCRGHNEAGIACSVVATAALENIMLTNCVLSTGNNNAALTVGGVAGTKNLLLVDSTFESALSSSTFLDSVTGLATGCTFRGKTIGLNVEAASAFIDFANCRAEGWTDAPNAAAYAISASNPTTFTGGELVATATGGGVAVAHAISGKVAVSNTRITGRGSYFQPVRQEYSGSAVLAADGPDNCKADIALPMRIINASKVQCAFSLQELSAAATPADHATFSFYVLAGFQTLWLRVRGQHTGKTVTFILREVY